MIRIGSRVKILDGEIAGTVVHIYRPATERARYQVKPDVLTGDPECDLFDCGKREIAELPS